MKNWKFRREDQSNDKAPQHPHTPQAAEVAQRSQNTPRQSQTRLRQPRALAPQPQPMTQHLLPISQQSQTTIPLLPISARQSPEIASPTLSDLQNQILGKYPSFSQGRRS